MTRRTQSHELRQADLSPDHMKSALPKLKRRIAELENADVASVVEREDVRFKALEQKYDDTLVSIFGKDTVEYKRYSIFSLDTAPITMYGTPINEIRKGYERGVRRAISSLTTIIELFEENLGDLGETQDGRALEAFGVLDIHPEIKRAVSELFRDGYYANAVEDACKVLDGLVKIRSGNSDLSGTKLMQHVFSPDKPALKFNNLASDTDKSEQQGMMFLYSGAMLALRNPRAHEIVEDDPEKALEYIAFLSLLAKSLDKAKRT